MCCRSNYCQNGLTILEEHAVLGPLLLLSPDYNSFTAYSSKHGGKKKKKKKKDDLCRWSSFSLNSQLESADW